MSVSSQGHSWFPPGSSKISELCAVERTRIRHTTWGGTPALNPLLWRGDTEPGTLRRMECSRPAMNILRDSCICKTEADPRRTWVRRVSQSGLHFSSLSHSEWSWHPHLDEPIFSPPPWVPGYTKPKNDNQHHVCGTTSEHPIWN